MSAYGQKAHSGKLLRLILGTVSNLQKSQDLVPEDIHVLRRLALRLITEYSVAQQKPISAPAKAEAA